MTVLHYDIFPGTRKFPALKKLNYPLTSLLANTYIIASQEEESKCPAHQNQKCSLSRFTTHAHINAKRGDPPSPPQAIGWLSLSFLHPPRGKMVAEKYVVDLDKPLVSQVGHLGEAYDEWVHQPIVSKEGPRFFESDFLEFFTRTVWWVIPIIWVPVASLFISTSVQMGLACPQVALFVVIGIFVWTFAEYMLHRFLFHVQTKNYWGNTMHYLLHGCHHKHPMDGLRLVFPPAAAAILATPIWYSVKLICTPSIAPAMFGGILLGYVMYDCTHYYLHHGQPKSDVPKSLKKFHLNHHYRLQTYGFGITSPLWDIVFGTLPRPSKVDGKHR
ncbi:hypothetical protein RIF29_26439 [Crotalaria pallida]|uniref:Fatty acid hydroxylase domain-containing protein n=1 Tax=Crotalaria pallida TaxID=3830 RepID=A0AAN9ESR6_CROPI